MAGGEEWWKDIDLSQKREFAAVRETAFAEATVMLEDRGVTFKDLHEKEKESLSVDLYNHLKSRGALVESLVDAAEDTVRQTLLGMRITKKQDQTEECGRAVASMLKEDPTRVLRLSPMLLGKELPSSLRATLWTLSIRSSHGRASSLASQGTFKTDVDTLLGASKYPQYVRDVAVAATVEPSADDIFSTVPLAWATEKEKLQFRDAASLSAQLRAMPHTTFDKSFGMAFAAHLRAADPALFEYLLGISKSQKVSLSDNVFKPMVQRRFAGIANQHVVLFLCDQCILMRDWRWMWLFAVHVIALVRDRLLKAQSMSQISKAINEGAHALTVNALQIQLRKSGVFDDMMTKSAFLPPRGPDLRPKMPSEPEVAPTNPAAGTSEPQEPEPSSSPGPSLVSEPPPASLVQPLAQPPSQGPAPPRPGAGGGPAWGNDETPISPSKKLPTRKLERSLPEPRGKKGAPANDKGKGKANAKPDKKDKKKKK